MQNNVTGDEESSFTEKSDTEQDAAAVKDDVAVVKSSTDNNTGDKKLTTPSCDTDKVSNSNDSSSPKHPRTPRFVYILSALATIGGFLFGYDIGIVAGSMLYIQPYFQLTTFWQEAIVSGTIGAAAVAALLSGWLTDKIGRKMTIMTAGVVFTVGGIVMGSAPNKEILLLGRVIAGLGVGLASVVVPVYVAESAPVHIRGRLVSMHQLLINTGIIVSSILAGGFSYLVPEGWRYMLGLAAIPGVLQFVGFLFMPESPRWLVSRGDVDQARSVLQRMRGRDDVTDELNDIITTVKEAEKESAVGIHHWIKIFRTRQVRRALFVGCALLFFQQWCGINTVIYYSGTVLKMAGFPVKYAVWLVTVPNLINFLSSFIGIYLVEKIGRRPLLIVSLAGTIIGLIILAVGFQLAAEHHASLNTTLIEVDNQGIVIKPCSSQYTTCTTCVKDSSCGYCYSDASDGTCLPHFNDERSSAGRCNESSSSESFYKWAYQYCPSDYTWVTLVGMAVFVFTFAPGLGPMPWTINSEIYPLWARSSCNSLAAATAWVCNLIISFTFLTMTEHITIHGTFWLFAAFTVIGVIFMVLMLPETKNKTLEEMELLFLSPKHRQELLASREQKVNNTSL
uniref:Major facilitator superfamily (MFS) profile domain-containing protein n=1 Tax=Arion vulgaris TaxID=1028688 RepID=A0A0B7AC28_9EUPU